MDEFAGIEDFYPRSRKGSDTGRGGGSMWFKGFLSTLPQGERRTFTIIIPFSGSFLSTLPQGERLPSAAHIVIAPTISIHAPARGATFSGFLLADSPAFLSTLPQGERPRRKSSRFPYLDSFLSTLPQGERPIIVSIDPLPRIFLSTLPQGERRGMVG